MKNTVNYNVYTKDGEYVTTINPVLKLRQNIDDETLEKIKALHVKRYYKTKRMEMISTPWILKSLAKGVEEIDFQLQDLWGWGRNSAYHHWTDVPHCTCPKMDNKENYGTNIRIINAECPVHGELK